MTWKNSKNVKIFCFKLSKFILVKAQGMDWLRKCRLASVKRKCWQQQTVPGSKNFNCFWWTISLIDINLGDEGRVPCIPLLSWKTHRVDAQRTLVPDLNVLTRSKFMFIRDCDKGKLSKQRRHHAEHHNGSLTQQLDVEMSPSLVSKKV